MSKEGVHGKVFYAWNIRPFPRYERTRSWYITMGIFAGLLLAYSAWTANFLFAFIILLVGFILYYSQRISPREILFQITEEGIEVGDRFYPYKELKKFWIVYDPPEVKNLYFHTQNTLHPELSIHLHRENPVKIRRTLLKYLFEDLNEQEESSTDKLSRLLKI